MDDKPRLTLGEMQRQAQGDDSPWRCPKCGASEFRVESTRYVEEGIRRRRVCRHCRQHAFVTVERYDGE